MRKYSHDTHDAAWQSRSPHKGRKHSERTAGNGQENQRRGRVLVPHTGPAPASGTDSHVCAFAGLGPVSKGRMRTWVTERVVGWRGVGPNGHLRTRPESLPQAKASSPTHSRGMLRSDILETAQHPPTGDRRQTSSLAQTMARQTTIVWL